jgi:hypothetical protein
VGRGTLRAAGCEPRRDRHGGSREIEETTTLGWDSDARKWICSRALAFSVRGDDDGRWDGDARKWIYSRALAISSVREARDVDLLASAGLLFSEAMEAPCLGGGDKEEIRPSTAYGWSGASNRETNKFGHRCCHCHCRQQTMPTLVEK